jgi:hypothetical protein
MDCDVHDGDEWYYEGAQQSHDHQEDGNGESITANGCARFLLWAAVSSSSIISAKTTTNTLKTKRCRFLYTICHDFLTAHRRPFLFRFFG